jgi:hypothetical protein
MGEEVLEFTLSLSFILSWLIFILFNGIILAFWS